MIGDRSSRGRQSRELHIDKLAPLQRVRVSRTRAAGLEFQTLFKIGAWHVTKPELIAILCVLAIVAFFWAAFRQAEDDPGPDSVPR